MCPGARSMTIRNSITRRRFDMADAQGRQLGPLHLPVTTAAPWPATSLQQNTAGRILQCHLLVKETAATSESSVETSDGDY